jgi:hypothetical protein
MYVHTQNPIPSMGMRLLWLHFICCARKMKMNAKVREFIPRDRCYDFLNIFAEKCSEKNGVFAQTTASFCKNYDNYIGF